MLRLSDFVAAKKRFYNLSRGSVSQLCTKCSRKMKLRTHIHLTLVRKFIMSTPFKGGRHIVLLRLASASALASGLTLRHPLLNFFLGAPKYDPSYVEIIFHW